MRFMGGCSRNEQVATRILGYCEIGREAGVTDSVGRSSVLLGTREERRSFLISANPPPSAVIIGVTLISRVSTELPYAMR